MFMADLMSPESSSTAGDANDASTPKTKRRRIGRKAATPGTPEVVLTTLLGVPGIMDFMHEVLRAYGGSLSVSKKISTGEMDAGIKTEEDKQRFALK
jgi:hypothetical protein